TVWGIVISLLSMSFMWYLIRQKTKVGTALNSPAILADAACSRACLSLSLVLMISSIGYELTGIGSLDAIGSMLISWLTLREGREAFGKARGMSCSCSCRCSADRTDTL
nr:cation transporter [Pseudomonadota bacterium]